VATDVLALVFFAALFSMFFFFWTELVKITRQQERTADALYEIAIALKRMEAPARKTHRRDTLAEDAAMDQV
jgi:hypothetical protein